MSRLLPLILVTVLLWIQLCICCHKEVVLRLTSDKWDFGDEEGHHEHNETDGHFEEEGLHTLALKSHYLTD